MGRRTRGECPVRERAVVHLETRRDRQYAFVWRRDRRYRVWGRVLFLRRRCAIRPAGAGNGHRAIDPVRGGSEDCRERCVQGRASEIPELNHIYGTIIANAPRHAGSTQANCCVFADREVDRSPTGSGTAGRVAQLYLRGQLGKDETLVNESVIGTVFKGRVLKEVKLGEFDAVIPEVEGNAFICGSRTGSSTTAIR